MDMIGLGPKLPRLQKKAMEKFGPPENRQGAIEELGAMKTPEAIDALLMRYTFRVDPGITDDDEKARVMALITEAGSATALTSVQKFIKFRDEISWPLRILSNLVSEAEMVKFLVETAHHEAGQYSRVPEKKKLLLHALGQHKDASITAAALPFLDDMDDDVIITAAETVVAQANDAGREPLIQTFLKAHEGSNARVREALAELLSNSSWDVKGYTPKVEAALPPAYKLDSKGKVVRK
jgi:MoxR-like ATPase